MSRLYNILNALVKRSKFTYTEVQIPITISGEVSAWAEAAVPTGFIAIEGYFIESIYCSIRNLTYNTQTQKNQYLREKLDGQLRDYNCERTGVRGIIALPGRGCVA